MQIVLAILMLALAPALLAAAEPRANSHTEAEIISRCDAGLADVLTFMRSKPELFRDNQEGLLAFEQKQEVWNTWKRFLEYQLALEAVQFPLELMPI